MGAALDIVFRKSKDPHCANCLHVFGCGASFLFRNMLMLELFMLLSMSVLQVVHVPCRMDDSFVDNVT